MDDSESEYSATLCVCLYLNIHCMPYCILLYCIRYTHTLVMSMYAMYSILIILQTHEHV